MQTCSQEYVLQGVTKSRKTERNGKWNETENEMKVSKENRFMNFVYTTAYKGKRFEIKQNLDFKSNLSNKSFIFNIWN